MYYIEPKIPKLAAIYVRTDPDPSGKLPAEAQAELCLRYCNSNKIPVSHIIHVNGTSEESLAYMKSLVRTLPKEIDAVFAARSYGYTTLLTELARLCLVFQCRPTWLYSLDTVGPLYQSIFSLETEDFMLADERYRKLLAES